MRHSHLNYVAALCAKNLCTDANAFIFPKKLGALVFSAWGCVFFCVPEFLFAFTFSPNRGKENKNIMKGLKEDDRLSVFLKRLGMRLCSHACRMPVCRLKRGLKT